MTSRITPSRRALVTALPLLVLASFAVLTPSCAWDGHFDLLGYTTQPNYDKRFRTIRVPVARNYTYWTVTPVPGLEMDFTRALIREIQAKTPYRVVQGDADTELSCAVVGFTKMLLNYTQMNNIREAETTLTVEFQWRDLRTGEVLTRPARRPGASADPIERQPLLTTADSMLPQGTKPVPLPSDPAIPTPEVDEPIDPIKKQKIPPILMRSVAHFRPELGESITTAMQQNVDQMAIQIVSALEKGW